MLELSSRSRTNGHEVTDIRCLFSIAY